MFYHRTLFNLEIAYDAIKRNQVRSLLTSLGIIFGVAAVISMLAVGTGAKQEIVERLKLVGVNNIVITPIVEQKEQKAEEDDGFKVKEKKFSPGLSLLDMQAIGSLLPSVENISPEIIIETSVISKSIKRSVKVVGVEKSYFGMFGLALSEGDFFSSKHSELGSAVCIVGAGIKKRFFPNENAIGKPIKCGQQWLTIIGVLSQRAVSESNLSKLGIRDVNMDVYIPLRTALIRYNNRSLITAAAIAAAENDDEDKSKMKAVNYHQLDKILVSVKETWQMSPTADAISRMLKRRHNGVVDYEISIPELLIKQEQRTKDVFNIVLGTIAGISLLVGGIGIMNIMLASVLERTKEIGIRKSLGAKNNDIVMQFLFEALIISISGGMIGILLGFLMSFLISTFASIPSVVSSFSVFVSFGVAAGVGLIFGIAPARQAARQDPISSLRYE